MEQTARSYLATELRKNDRLVTSATGEITGTVQSYVLKVLPLDLISTIRAVAMDELNQQISIQNNPSQIIVDNRPVSKHGIMAARRRVSMRFQDTRTLVAAVMDLYRLLQQLTRIQVPPKNAIVARTRFHLWLNGADLGTMPQALSKVQPNTLTQDTVFRVVGPLVNYGRKLFWNPVGASLNMAFHRYKSPRSSSGYRFTPVKSAGQASNLYSPRFKPFTSRTMRRKANATSAPAQALAAMMSGATPPGRVENTGQMVKRIMRGNRKYKGLHIADGWVQYPAAIGWSKLRDSRVPSYSIQFAKRGAMPVNFSFI